MPGCRSAAADVFVNVAGGVRIDEPGADLGIALAIASAAKGVPVRDGVAAFGEIGLTGRLRAAAQADRRARGMPQARLARSRSSGTRRSARRSRPRWLDFADLAGIFAKNGGFAGFLVPWQSSPVEPSGPPALSRLQTEPEAHLYKVGDKVVYPHHGAGTVVKREKREVLGEKREYLTIKILHNDMTVNVPADNAERVGLRKVIDEEAVKKVVKYLTSGGTEMPKNWNRRFKHNRDKMKTGDIYELAEVVRNLALRDGEKGLSTGEKQMYVKAKKILASELMYAKNMSEDEALEWLEETLTERREAEGRARRAEGRSRRKRPRRRREGRRREDGRAGRRRRPCRAAREDARRRRSPPRRRKSTPPP